MIIHFFDGIPAVNQAVNADASWNVDELRLVYRKMSDVGRTAEDVGSDQLHQLHTILMNVGVILDAPGKRRCFTLFS